MAAISSARGEPSAPHSPGQPIRLPQGAILRAIVGVLAAHPQGLRTVEIRERVEQVLGRPIGKSAINDRLWRIRSSSVSDEDPQARYVARRRTLRVSLSAPYTKFFCGRRPGLVREVAHPFVLADFPAVDLVVELKAGIHGLPILLL